MIVSMILVFGSTMAVSTTENIADRTLKVATMVWLLSDMAQKMDRTTGLSKTLGAAIGARKVTSRWPGTKTTTVELQLMPVMLLHNSKFCLRIKGYERIFWWWALLLMIKH